MNKIIPAFLFLFILFSESFASGIDSTLYETDYERKIFEKIADSVKIKPVELFLSVNYSAESEAVSSKIANFIVKFKATKYSPGNNAKTLKNLYKAVHTEFLKKYSEEAYFNDIFKTGDYNCVTASALYAIILDELGIDNHIKMTPNHVYLIADPQKTSFLIETTLPSNGVKVFDDNTKKNFVKYLHDNKIISDKEFNDESIDNLFLKHFSTDKTINTTQLAGIQYYNKGTFQYNKEKYKASLQNFEKAKKLFDDPSVAYLEYSALAQILDDENNKRNYNGRNLAKFLNNCAKSTEYQSNGIQYFVGVCTELVVNHPDVAKLKDYYSDFCSFINDSVNHSDIDHNYYFYLGYSHFSNFRYPQALNNLSVAYTINPDNVNTRNLITETIGKKYAKYVENIPDIDTLSADLNKFPFLTQNPVMVNYFVYVCSGLAQESFLKLNYRKANTYLAKLETFSNNNPDAKIEENVISSLYGEIAGHYYRNKDFKKAVEYLNRGLSVAKNSSVLKTRLNNILSSHPHLINQSIVINQSTNDIQRTELNKEIDLYLYKSWLVSAFDEEFSFFFGNNKEKVTFSFSKPNNFKMKSGADITNGYFVFNKTKNVIELKSASNVDLMCIAVTSINDSEFKGLMYFKSDPFETVNISLIATN